MNITMQADVIQATRYDMDGNKGASISATQQSDGSNANRAGLDIMKMAADYDVVEQLRAHLPCTCEIVAKPEQGAGQKMSFRVVSVKPVKAQRPAA